MIGCVLIFFLISCISFALVESISYDKRVLNNASRSNSSNTPLLAEDTSTLLVIEKKLDLLISIHDVEDSRKKFRDKRRTDLDIINKKLDTLLEAYELKLPEDK